MSFVFVVLPSVDGANYYIRPDLVSAISPDSDENQCVVHIPNDSAYLEINLSAKRTAEIITEALKELAADKAMYSVLRGENA